MKLNPSYCNDIKIPRAVKVTFDDISEIDKLWVRVHLGITSEDELTFMALIATINQDGLCNL